MGPRRFGAGTRWVSPASGLSPRRWASLQTPWPSRPPPLPTRSSGRRPVVSHPALVPGGPRGHRPLEKNATGGWVGMPTLSTRTTGPESLPVELVHRMGNAPTRGRRVSPASGMSPPSRTPRQLHAAGLSLETSWPSRPPSLSTRSPSARPVVSHTALVPGGPRGHRPLEKHPTAGEWECRRYLTKHRGRNHSRSSSCTGSGHVARRARARGSKGAKPP